MIETIYIGDRGPFRISTELADNLAQTLRVISDLYSQAIIEIDPPESKLYPIHLIDSGARIVQVIKVLREILGCSLKFAKLMCDNTVICPQLIGHYPYETILKYKNHLEAIGATVQIPSALHMLGSSFD